MLRLVGVSRAARWWQGGVSHRAFSPRAGALSIGPEVRNVGIFAHIDAGKTTTSEAVLYLCGAIRSVGLVDSGDTVMDFLPQERERGITISAAAVSCNWRGYTINLIDTPGHVDFTMEVERTARVLDGSVLVVDAVAGVQAQTKSVWRAISKRSLPTVVFINKMDRVGADWLQAMKSIETKLGAQPLALQFPIDGDRVVDLLGWKVLSYAPTEQKGMPGAVAATAVAEGEPFYEAAVRSRKELFDRLADVDEAFMETCLEHDYAEMPIPPVLAALRRACIDRQVLPVVFGSALRGKGLQPLLDCMVGLLPDPIETHRRLALQHIESGEIKTVDLTRDANALYAMAFKVVHDPQRGSLVYARIFSGSLQPKVSVFNSTARCEERVHQILSIQADSLAQLPEAPAGSVVCLIGMKKTKTGDTLVLNTGTHKGWVLEGLQVPPPVYSVALEPESESKQKDLEQALKWIALEDPSIIVEISEESGQTIVQGLGELHIDILVDRLKRQFKVPVCIGQTYIGYRESLNLSEPMSFEYAYDVVRDQKRVFAQIGLTVKRRDDTLPCKFVATKEVIAQLKGDELYVLLDALQISARHGAKGYPVVGLDVTLCAVEREDGATTSGAFRACAAMAMRKLLLDHQDCFELLEPVMDVEINSPHAFMGDIISDLTALRRGDLKEVVESAAGACTITASVPLQTLLGYATTLRSKSHGEAAFTAEYAQHRPTNM